MAPTKNIWLYSDLLRAFKGKHSSALGVWQRGTIIFLRPQCPITRTHLRQRETESYNTLNCSNNKTIYGNGLFCHNKWVAKRQGHHNLEFHIVHLLEPAPQTQTATAHLQTTWTVYFDGQGTQKWEYWMIEDSSIAWCGTFCNGVVHLQRTRVYRSPMPFLQKETQL